MKPSLFTRASELDGLLAYIEDADCCYGGSCQLGEIEKRLNVVPNSLGGLTALSAQESAKLFVPACQSVKP